MCFWCAAAYRAGPSPSLHASGFGPTPPATIKETHHGADPTPHAAANLRRCGRRGPRGRARPGAVRRPCRHPRARRQNPRPTALGGARCRPEGAAGRARHPHRGALRRHVARLADPAQRPPRGGAHAAELGRRRGRRVAGGGAGSCRQGAPALLRSPAGGPVRPERAARRAACRAGQRHLVPCARLRRHASQDHHPSRPARWRRR